MLTRENITRNSIIRRRWLCVAAAVFVLMLGWSARAKAATLPPFLGAYAPDALWALLVLLLIAALKPCWTPQRQAVAALGFAYLIELSQLYQAPWINGIRSTRLGGLVLGHGFLWSDLLCYTVGIGSGALLNFWLVHGRKDKNSVADFRCEAN